MNIVDIVASEPHYLDHLLPIWEALPAENRGSLYVQETGHAVDVQESGQPGNVVVVSSYTDMLRVRGQGRPIVYTEHGIGISYPRGGDSYAGGRHRQDVKLFLCPNDEVRRLNQQMHPEIPAVVVG